MNPAEPGSSNVQPSPSGLRRRALWVEWSLLMLLVVGFAALAAPRDERGGWLRSVDWWLYDRAVVQLSGPLSDDVVILGIDEQSLHRLGRWPWDRADQARLWRALAAAEPASVVLDILYSEPTQPEADAALAAALAQLPKLTMPVVIEAVTQSGQLLELLPLPPFLRSAEQLGHVHPELDDDGLARGVLLWQGINRPHWPHIALAHLGDRARYQPDCEAEEFSLINARCAYRMVPFLGPPESFEHISALDLLRDDGSAAMAALRGKTVLVGLTATGVSDWVTTPVSGRGRPMAGVEFNANVLLAVRDATLITPVEPLAVLLLTLLLAALSPLTLPRLRPGTMLLATLAFALVPVLVFYLLLYFARLYLPLSAASVAALLTYPLWSWRRLEIAWRFLRREIQRFRAERLQLGHAAPDDLRLRGMIDHAAAVLGARASVLPVLTAVDEPVVSQTEQAGVQHLQVLAPFNDRALDINLTRESPFVPKEQAFLTDLLREATHEDAERHLVLERLTSEIRELNRLANDVRTIRDVNMRSLEQITSGVGLVSLGGRIEFANSSFLRLTGLAADDDVLSIARQVAPLAGETWPQVVRRVVVDGDAVSFETQSGNARVRLDMAPLQLAASTRDYWLMTAVDVTAIRLAERQREEALAFLSHDLRSPMVSILALVRSERGGSEARADLLRRVEGYAQKSLNVSEQFVQLSRVENLSEIDVYDLDLVDVASNAKGTGVRTGPRQTNRHRIHRRGRRRGAVAGRQRRTAGAGRDQPADQRG